jgi:osmotically-inducible protein OsmY
MTSDSTIKFHVEQELKSDPVLSAGDIAVAVHAGVVTLTGFVRYYRHRRQAETAVRRVAGVTAVVNDIEVRLPLLHRRPDPQIVRDAVAALRRSLPRASNNIVVSVSDGWLKLEGEVEWDFEREEAKWDVAPVRGVIGVTNDIRIKPKVAAADVRSVIAAAFRRSATIDASGIEVDVVGDQVTLRGTVHALREREEAERSAWRVPGIAHVDNRLEVTL